MGVEGLFKFVQTSCYDDSISLVVEKDKPTIQTDALYIEFNNFIHQAYQECVYKVNDIILDMIVDAHPFMFEYIDQVKVLPAKMYQLRMQELGISVPPIFPTKSLETFIQWRKFIFIHLVQSFTTNLVTIVFNKCQKGLLKLFEHVDKSSLQELYICVDGVPSKHKIMKQIDGKRKVAISRCILELLIDQMNSRSMSQEAQNDIILHYRIMYEEYRVEDTKNIITPGSHFMNCICKLLQSWGTLFVESTNIVFTLSDTNEAGEGEYKIMRHCFNKTSVKSLICTPDADVTLLAIIARNTKKLDINILHYAQEESLYYYIDTQLIINKISEQIECSTSKTINDVIFLVTIFGNDIVPKPKTLEIYNLPQFLNTYQDFIKKNQTHLIEWDIDTNSFVLQSTALVAFFKECALWERSVARFNFMRQKFGGRFDKRYDACNTNNERDLTFEEFVYKFNYKPSKSFDETFFKRDIQSNNFIKKAFIQKRQKWITDSKVKVKYGPLLRAQIYDSLGIDLHKEIGQKYPSLFDPYFVYDNKNEIESIESLKSAMFLQPEDVYAYVVDKTLEPYHSQLQHFDLVETCSNRSELICRDATYTNMCDYICKTNISSFDQNSTNEDVVSDYMLGLSLLVRQYWHPEINDIYTWSYKWPFAPLMYQIANHVVKKFIVKDIILPMDDTYFTPSQHLFYIMPITMLNINCNIFMAKDVKRMSLVSYAKSNDMCIRNIATMWLKANPKVWSLIGCNGCFDLRRSYTFGLNKLNNCFTTPFGHSSVHWKDDKAFLTSLLQRNK